MAEPELIQQERQILRRFREATLQRAKAETEAEARRKSEKEAYDATFKKSTQEAEAFRTKGLADASNRLKTERGAADNVLHQAEQQGNERLNKVRGMFNDARDLMVKGKWQKFIEGLTVSPRTSGASGDPLSEMDRCVSRANTSFTSLRKSMELSLSSGQVVVIGPNKLWAFCVLWFILSLVGIFIAYVVIGVAFGIRISSSTEVNLANAGTVGSGVIFGAFMAFGVVTRNNRSRVDRYKSLAQFTIETEYWHKAFLDPIRERHNAQITAAEIPYKRAVEQTERQYQNRLGQITPEHQQKLSGCEARYFQAMSTARTEYEAAMLDIKRDAEALVQSIDSLSPPWDGALWKAWTTVTDGSAPQFSRIGRFDEVGSWDNLDLPALDTFIGGRSLLFKAAGAGKAAANRFAQVLLLRLLAALPPGKMRFTFIDPIGLGQNVAAMMHLADHDEMLITGKKAWTEPPHIEQRLVDLTEHMENVIQKYLRNQYATIEDYNAKANEIAESYRVLVIFDFPANFSEIAARRLVSVVQNGPRCGVYALVLADTTLKKPNDFDLSQLEPACTVLNWDEKRFVWQDDDFRNCLLELDSLPDSQLIDQIIRQVGEASIEASKVEVPFERIAPPVEKWWEGNSRTGLSIPLGPAGARKVRSLDLGKDTAQHVLIVGQTGSGKSTLLHTLITNCALAYSPAEVELYLVDFKKGVEFKTYATHQLPHARVIAIESEREFGLSVLQGLDGELKRRGDLFRAARVDHIMDYRAKNGQAMPRILLVVDEFQEFFTDDDAIASQASQVLDRLVRQGRAFGIHILLGSQTLAGAYTLARSTIDQMAVRIALKCSEADSRLVFADDNPAARVLSRPGEAIYNAMNGLVGGNDHFQVAWLPDEKRDQYLESVQELVHKQQYRPPRPQIIFEGNSPAEVEKNRTLSDLIASPTFTSPSRITLAWIGEPIAIRDSVAVNFRRQSGSNLLIVGQNDEAAMGMMAVALTSFAAQLQSYSGEQAEGGCDFYILDFGAVDASYADYFTRFAEYMLRPPKIGRRRRLPEYINELAAEVHRRMDASEANAPKYLFLYGLQRARDLRQDEGMGFSFSNEEPAAPNVTQQFATILREGPDVGIHTLVWCDTVTNLNRALERRALREFAMRVVFQMSAEDSSNLIDTPVASKLGAYRALFYSEEEGRLEKFQPYALPSQQWLEWVGEHLRGKVIGA